ncbi:BTAD domain-containing putative transcriptional regulator [Micromonospora sp. WMMD1128]|uniref:AfsR/SARP family transcriptional regulator n=1 Tax=Micromonospora sp. WMMD1128 TaxID=3015150 RepID=UPI00248C3368|nr:BTAD domain-containing putative transcriptional regulator [Micromonospora sp. WMMD1128]WBB75709.1 BTAD domain-containing putative transcriptional regulator [Micromonospora sp. WMMD1128]
MGKALQVTLLGPVSAVVDGAGSDLGSPRQRALFATLAARPNQRVRRDDLIDGVWGLDAPLTVTNSIYTYVNRLRRLLEPHRPHRAPSQVLLSEGSSYVLRLDPTQVDSCSFIQHVERARQLRAAGDADRAVTELSQGLALWRGVALDGTHGPFVEAERARLDELRLAVLEDRAEMLLELGRQMEAVGELVPLVRLHPLRERLRHLLVLSYARLGSRAEALAEIRDLRETLSTELGLDPPAAMRRLQEQILRGEVHATDAGGSGPASDADTGRPGHVGSGSPAPPARPSAGTPAALPMNPAQLPRDVPGFLGRHCEIAGLYKSVCEAEAEGAPPVILIGGPPGVGKSTLAVHFAHQIADRYPDGQLHLDLRGFAREPEPMSSAEALGHLLAGLGVEPDLPSDVDRRAGLYRSLMAGRRMILLIDNARWIEQVRPLLPPSRSCLVLVTSRNRLSGLTARDGARRVNLDPMCDDDLLGLIRCVIGGGTVEDRSVLRTVVAACGRLPLAVRIAAERISTARLPAEAFAEASTPGELLDVLETPGDPQSCMREVLHWSYRALSAEAAAMFDALGRHGGSAFDLETAAALSRTSVRQAWWAVGALVDSNLVEQRDWDRYEINPLIHAYAVERAGADQG